MIRAHVSPTSAVRQRRSRPFLRHAITSLALPWALAGMLAAAPSQAAAADKTARVASAKAPKPHKRAGLRVKDSQNHSGETPAQRDRRLLRECKGLPNAGACRGYARP
ncbi:hypothetical protein [Acidovorax sp. FG27]|uniref:hypothetical protein n=1 Tax=Acidovorax sp. FG27 TaxID=3133652 RepID=UPI00334013D2